jgi:hypothetical protein
LRAALVVLGFVLSGGASPVTGVVVDPQGLPVPGARVELACPEHRASVTTDAQGRFEIAGAADACRLSVLHRGFSPVHQPVGRATAFVLRLRVADVTETATVTPDAAARLRRVAPGSVSLIDTELKAVAGNTRDLVRYASLLVGAAIRPTTVYVDGLPAGVLPPIDAIERISVNADAFAAEFANGDVTFIQIITKAPARTFRVTAASDLLGLGGGDVIAPGSHSASRFGNVRVTGPVPHLPVTFSSAVSVGRTSMDVPIRAVLPDRGAGPDTAIATNRIWSGAVDLHYSPTPPIRIRSSYQQSRADAGNLGVGGIVVPEAGFASSFVAREARATMTAIGSRLLYEGGVIAGQTSSKTMANSAGMGIAVSGDVVMGGSSISRAQTNRIQWTSKHVLRSQSSRPWSAGITVAGTDDSSRLAPNPAGTFQFADAESYATALAGGATGTWFVTRGHQAVRYINVTAAPFLQKTLARSKYVELDAGVRADFQAGFGTIVAPRMSIAGEWRGVNIRAGAGLFVRTLPAAIFVAAIANDGRHLEQFMATDVSFVNVASAQLDGQGSIRSRLSPTLARPRQWMERISVERRLGNLTSAVEYTWTEDALLGSRRLAVGAGWADVVESNRAARGRRLHLRAAYTWKRQQLVANYEWTRARDNSDGPFSFLERADDIAAEFVRSAGVSPRNFTAAGTFRLPAAVSLTISDTWRNSAPFDITTGSDVLRTGLTVDRGGRARNSGTGPGYHSVAAYGYRRIPLPKIPGRPVRRHYLDLGVQADNILDRRNYISVGSVAGSSTFGRPLAAFPGRSVRLFLSVD